MTTHRFRTTHCPVHGCDRGEGTRGHKTRHPTDPRCLPHRAEGRFPMASASKHDVDAHLGGGAA